MHVNTSLHGVRILVAWCRYESGDAELLAEIEATNAAQDSSDEDAAPVAAESVRKRPGKGSTGKNKGKKTKIKKGGDAISREQPAFGTRKLPAELSYIERLDDIIMRAPMVVRIVIGLATGGIVGAYAGYTVLEWDFLWGGLVTVVISWATAAIVGFLPLLLVRLSCFPWHMRRSF